MRHLINSLFSTRKAGRVRLIRVGRICVAVGVLRKPVPGYIVPSRRVPVWLDGAGVRIKLPEILHS